MKEIKVNLIEDLQKLPEAIDGKARSIYADKEKSNVMQNSLKKIEILTWKEITEEVNEDGKPVFSNKMKRDVELERRLEANEEYQALSTSIENLQVTLSNMQLDLSFLEKRFSAAKALARLIGD